MTVTVYCLSDTSAASRSDFVNSFAEALTTAAYPPVAGPPVSPAYTRTVIDAASDRPADLLLACHGERVVGRALVAKSRARPETAVVGLFEIEPGPCVPSTGALLISAASDWARRTGHTRMFAPVDLTTWFNYRFMVRDEGDAHIPRFAWEPPDRPEYLDLFRIAGFTEGDRYCTVGVELDTTGPSSIEAPIEATAGAYHTAVAAGYAFEQVTTLDRLVALLDDLHPLCTEAFSDNPLFEPLPLETFRTLHVRAATARDSTLTHVVRRPDGRLAGFVFAFVDRDAVVFKTIAVTPSVRGRRLSTALTHLVLARATERGHCAFISALVRAGNTSQLLIEPRLVPGMHTWTHEYVLLERSIR